MTAAEITRAVELLAVQRVAAEAVKRWGATAQLRQVQEECGELIAAINRDARGRDGARENLLEELGQVFVLLLQAREIVGHEAFDLAVRAAEEKTIERMHASAK